jgi:hypothetical protein
MIRFASGKFASWGNVIAATHQPPAFRINQAGFVRNSRPLTPPPPTSSVARERCGVRTISSASIFAKEIAEISLTGRAFAQCVFKNKSRTCRGNLDFDTGRRISWSTDQLCVWQRGIYKQEG